MDSWWWYHCMPCPSKLELIYILLSLKMNTWSTAFFFFRHGTLKWSVIQWAFAEHSKYCYANATFLDFDLICETWLREGDRLCYSWATLPWCVKAAASRVWAWLYFMETSILGIEIRIFYHSHIWWNILLILYTIKKYKKHILLIDCTKPGGRLGLIHRLSLFTGPWLELILRKSVLTWFVLSFISGDWS